MFFGCFFFFQEPIRRMTASCLQPTFLCFLSLQTSNRRTVGCARCKPQTSYLCIQLPFPFHWSTILEYITLCVYLRVENNVMTDCLSRNVGAVFVDAFDLKTIVEEQALDTEIQQYKENLRNYLFSSGATPLSYIQNHLSQTISVGPFLIICIITRTLELKLL